MRHEGAAVEARALSDEQRETALKLVAKYPNPRSAILPLLFLVQSVEGYVTETGMREVAGIIGLEPAQVLATASFYTMLKKAPQGDYLISVCRNIACTHLGGRKVIAALEDRLGVTAGETTEDGKFTLESAECLATCDGAPSLQVNYEDFYRMSAVEAVALVGRLERGEQVTSFRGEAVKSAREISYETAVAGLQAPGTAGELSERTIGGESPRSDTAPGTRPKETGEGSPNA
ncbi:MAG: NAD(P)H-dependent oxidoreductase subunit E [Actinobacteria bacterium]|nr:NAD(P)H-dependent oxidoreductase subunit E [Actinomycetota bacterium]